MNGKGSRQRDSHVPDHKVRDNWDKIFNKEIKAVEINNVSDLPKPIDGAITLECNTFYTINCNIKNARITSPQQSRVN